VSKEDCFLGLDLGTSGCRAIAIDRTGRSLALARSVLPPPLRTPDGGSEQAPELWWQAVQQVLRELTSHLRDRRIRALAVDGTSASLLLADQGGCPLGLALMYDDSRARTQLEAIRAAAPAEAAVHSATSSLAKLLYLLQRERVRPASLRALHQADWILGRLSGRYGLSDENNCLKLGYDAKRRCWPNWLQRLDLPMECLPHVLPPGRKVGQLSLESAGATGLPQDTQLVTGTTDSTAAVLATGAGTPGDAVTTLGSTLVLKLLSERPITAPEYGVYSHRLGDLWLVGGASNAGAAVCAHYFTPERMQALTPALDPDRDTGLDYYPLLTPGERFPVNDPDYAPRLGPRPAQDALFFQGILEGLSRIEARGYGLLQDLGAPRPRRVLSIGGGATNPAWRRIRERLLGVPVLLAEHQEAAYGTARLARSGVLEDQSGDRG
jgi:sugar (pentulose or hexulose) kinase